MTLTQHTTGTSRKRNFAGEERGTPLAIWLENRKIQPKARQRIAGLIQRMNEMQQLVTELRSSFVNEAVDDEMEKVASKSGVERERVRADRVRAMMREWQGKKWPHSARADELHLQINRALAFYSGYVMQLDRFDEAGNGVFALTVHKPSKASEDELTALNVVLAFSAKGLLQHVRRCDFCRRWFYARIDAQVQCSERCRLRKYRSSEKALAKQRERQRELYHLHKNLVMRGGK